MNGQPKYNLVIVFSFFWLTLLMTACAVEPAAGTTTAIAPTVTARVAHQPESTLSLESLGNVANGIPTIIAERTPQPTQVPGFLTKEIDQIIQGTELGGKTFLGLTTEDWGNIVASALIAVVGYTLVLRLLLSLLNRVVRQTKTNFDDEFLNIIGRELKWLVEVVIARFAVLRLEFWNDAFRLILDDIFFVLVMVVIFITVWKLIEFSTKWYRDYLEPEGDKSSFDPYVIMTQRVVYALVTTIFLSIGLNHFGFPIHALILILVVFAVAIGIGIKVVDVDVVSGFTILVDKPFRVGDAILIEELENWGIVTDIGTRTTRILLPDNREVIVPNSQISESQVVNYSSPDLRYRVQTDLRLAYGSDINQARQIIRDAVRGVEVVLPDMPVEVFFLEFGDSARLVRVRWWIDNYEDEYSALDLVNAAVQSALDEAAIKIAFTAYDLSVTMEGENANPVKPPPAN
jgi:small-conductance mechanosensitive channel